MPLVSSCRYLKNLTTKGTKGTKKLGTINRTDYRLYETGEGLGLVRGS